MRCRFEYCKEETSPAVGVANLRGKPGTALIGLSGQYPLCAYHYTEAASGRWQNVILAGWEWFPGFPLVTMPIVTIDVSTGLMD